MFAMLDGLKTRVSNLTARHEAEEAAGDDAAAARTAEEGRLRLVDVPRPALGRRRRSVRERRAAVPRRADAAVLAVLRRAHGGAGELTIGGSVIDLSLFPL